MVSEEFFLINLKNYKTQNFSGGSISVWNKVPVARRSLVFILLFLGNMGELRVVLTKRSSKLRNFPGHISFPGGKADLAVENEWQVSRREMEEEIGLNSNDDVLLSEYGFQINHINTLPCYLSRTFSAVKPCIGFMDFARPSTASTSDHLEEVLHKKIQMNLNPGESSSIFSCPLKDFLYPAANSSDPSESIDRLSFKVSWGKIPWNLRSYTFPQNNPHEVEWLRDIKDLSDLESPSETESPDEDAETEAESEQIQKELKESKKNKLQEWGRLGSRRHSLTNEKIYDVWGLTANILHDLAELTYNTTRESGSKLTRQLGEEELIHLLWSKGNQMQAKERSLEELKLIVSTSARDELGFDAVLPRTEFLRLKSLYKE